MPMSLPLNLDGVQAGVSPDASSADNATALAAVLTTSGHVFLPNGSTDTPINSFSMAGDGLLAGQKSYTVLTNPSGANDYGITMPDSTNNGALHRLKLAPKSGSSSHKAVKVGLCNGITLDDLNISGAYSVAVEFNSSTGPKIIGGALGNGSAIGVAVSGATNGAAFIAPVIAYPTTCGYQFNAGAQANSILGGETAAADGGTSIVVDRANSTSFFGHNSESQASGGTPVNFYAIGNSGTSTGTYNTLLKNCNIIANKGNVANAIETYSPVFGMAIEQLKINANKITNAIVRFKSSNAIASVRDLFVTSRAGGVVDIDFPADSGYMPATQYTLANVWDFFFNKALLYFIAGPQARSAFPSGAPAPVLQVDVADDANLGVLLARSRNGSQVTFQVNAKTGAVIQGDGSALTGAVWRDWGIQSADPSGPSNGDKWIRGDLSPPQQRYRIGGATYYAALTAA